MARVRAATPLGTRTSKVLVTRPERQDARRERRQSRAVMASATAWSPSSACMLGARSCGRGVPHTRPVAPSRRRACQRAQRISASAVHISKRSVCQRKRHKGDYCSESARPLDFIGCGAGRDTRFVLCEAHSVARMTRASDGIWTTRGP